MNQRLLIGLIGSSLLCSLCGHAFSSATVTPVVGDDPAGLAEAGHLKCNCCWGNLHAPAFDIEDEIGGAEAYKFLFQPPAWRCSCPVGFHVDNVSMLVKFGPEDVPATFDVFADLEEATWDGECWVPGVELCISQVYTLEITEPGYHVLSVPIFDECDCAFLDYWYFLSLHFVSEFRPDCRPSAVVDQYPVGCTSYNDHGAGWRDLVSDDGWAGEILIWSEIACCAEPVVKQATTWGGVKGLYR